MVYVKNHSCQISPGMRFNQKFVFLLKNNNIFAGLRFGFSENFVFGKFDIFCDRLTKIIAMFNLIDDYNHLFARRLEGLLLGEALEEAMAVFEDAKKLVVSKKYDYLDHRNPEFNVDYNAFIAKTDALKTSIGTVIESNFDTVWETPQCMRFLIRFEKVSFL